MKMSFLNQRQQKLMRKFGRDAVAIIPSSTLIFRNNDVHYPFRQNSDFWYLTGFHEPNAVAVLKTDSAGEMIYTLFCQPKDDLAERWHGKRVGLEGVCEHFGVDMAFSMADFEEKMVDILSEASRVYTLKAPQLTVPEYQQSLQSGVLAEWSNKTYPLEDALHEMRLIKSSEEIDWMRAAANISVQAHQYAMSLTQPGMDACEVQAALELVIRSKGCSHLAYDSIVAGGSNACTLHYTENKGALESGDLLLIDAGAECQCYAADITRTFPVSGRFSDAQRALYNVVLNAQQQVIKAVKPGVNWDVLQKLSVKIIVDGLVSLGILKGSSQALIKSEAYKRFYMHGVGHWLGLDVHDVGARHVGKKPRPFEAGMALTVEPGIYIPLESEGVDKKWHGIGIRIEDDVVVTEDGCDVLTADLIKSPEAIEALMSQ